MNDPPSSLHRRIPLTRKAPSANLQIIRIENFGQGWTSDFTGAHKPSEEGTYKDLAGRWGINTVIDLRDDPAGENERPIGDLWE